MKKALFSFVLVAYSLLSFSGEKDSIATKKSRHEIMFGVNNPLYKSTFGSINDIYSSLLLNNIYGSYYDYYMYPNFYPNYYNYSAIYDESLFFNALQDGRKLGLGYRFHLKNSSVRVLINGDSKTEGGNENYDYNNDALYSDFISSQEYSYKMSSVQARLGYQLHLTKGKAQLFYGLDLFYKTFQYQSNQSFTYSDWDYQFVNNTFEYVLFENTHKNELNYVQTSLGFSPVLGFRYFLSDNPSISTESYLDFGMNSTKSKTNYSVNYGNTDNEDYSSESSEESKSREMKAVPVSIISLNFHF